MYHISLSRLFPYEMDKSWTHVFTSIYTQIHVHTVFSGPQPMTIKKSSSLPLTCLGPETVKREGAGMGHTTESHTLHSGKKGLN